MNRRQQWKAVYEAAIEAEYQRLLEMKRQDPHGWRNSTDEGIKTAAIFNVNTGKVGK